MNEEFEKHVKELKEEREKLESIQVNLKSKKEDYEKSIQQEKEQLELHKSKIEGIEKTINELATNHFKETGEKSLYGGIKVQEANVISYDPDKAFNWAKEHSLCLSLDTKSFETLAKIQQFDFVTIKKEPKATFPKVIKIEEAD